MNGQTILKIFLAGLMAVTLAASEPGKKPGAYLGELTWVEAAKATAEKGKKTLEIMTGNWIKILEGFITAPLMKQKS